MHHGHKLLRPLPDSTFKAACFERIVKEPEREKELELSVKVIPVLDSLT